MKRFFVLALAGLIASSVFMSVPAFATSSYHVVSPEDKQENSVPVSNTDNTQTGEVEEANVDEQSRNQKNEVFSDFDPEQYEPCRVLLDIETSKGGFLSKYEIEVYVDEQLVCAIKDGASYRGIVEVRSANHYIRFLRKHSKENMISKNLTISDDSTIKCSLIRGRDQLEEESFGFTRGIKEANLDSLETTRIDAYNFTFSIGSGRISTKRGWSTSFDVYDLTNGIVVSVHRSHIKGEDKDFYSPDLLRIEDGKIRYIKDGAWSKSYYYIENGILYYVNEQGEVTSEEKISEYNTLGHKSLKEIGFYDEYPTPSSVYAALKEEYASDGQ